MNINKPLGIRRDTIQKIKILDYLRSVKSHPTAETIFKEVKKEIPTITLATVYRNLNQLAKDLKILKLEINKEFHFDADLSLHQHFFCEECENIFDIFQKNISEYAIKNLKDSKFMVKIAQITFFGICANCRGK